jgi:hypothetical protein
LKITYFSPKKISEKAIELNSRAFGTWKKVIKRR